LQPRRLLLVQPATSFEEAAKERELVGVVDEYVLLIHPLELGSGRRLFADVGPVAIPTL
jgi:hypothetical protein